MRAPSGDKPWVAAFCAVKNVRQYLHFALNSPLEWALRLNDQIHQLIIAECILK